jgi:hypothetical protein
MIPGFLQYGIISSPKNIHHIKRQEAIFGSPIEPYLSTSKDSIWNNADVIKKCPRTKKPVKREDVQLIQDHIFLLGIIDQTPNVKGVFITTERTHIISNEDVIREFVKDCGQITNGTWDVLVLGANAYNSSMPLSHSIERIHVMRQPVAMFIKKDCIPKIVKAFMDILKTDHFPSLPLIYSKAESNGLLMVGPWHSRIYAVGF